MIAPKCKDRDFPFLGFGAGLRPQHYRFIFERWPRVDWFEIISENYMVAGGRPLHNLEKIRERYPVVMHGVSLSIGSSDPLDKDYLRRLKGLAQKVQPAWVSDHLCWTGVGGKNLHDLLPLPYTEETIHHVVKRVKLIQDFLGRQILLENVSSYMTYTQSSMSEWEFLTAIAQEADCKILLDINNIYVSAMNHGFDPEDYLRAIPQDRVVQFHLAGHSDRDGYLLDTHDHPVKPQVWALYRKALERFSDVSTMIEWDENIPPFSVLLKSIEKAKSLYEKSNPVQTQNDATLPLAAHYGA